MTEGGFIRKLRDRRNYAINQFPRLMTRDIDPDVIAPRTYLLDHKPRQELEDDLLDAME